MKVQNSKVLVTGGNGMIGRSLVELLLQQNNEVTIADLFIPENKIEGVTYIQGDLRYFDFTQKICEGQDYVFHLAGVKGSPKMSSENPASFMVPMLQFNTNMMESARLAGVKWYLYTSSVGVYHPAEVFYEDDVWKTFPSPHDKFPGWAKRMGELQSEAYDIQYGMKNISIVRPANVYGPYDNFNPETAMVIPSFIRKVMENDEIEAWGDGSNIRDFIYSEDVARGMLFVVENEITEPVNLGSGEGYTIKEIMDTIIQLSGKEVKVNWLVDKPSGDIKRLFDISRISSKGFELKYDLQNGLKNTISYYLNNIEIIDNRTQYFK
jgi:GDP-L-fucose synthase